MSGIEPTQPDYIRRLIDERVRHITPQLGVVEEAYPHSEEGDDSNYEVDVRIITSGVVPSAPEDDGEGEGEGDGEEEDGDAAEEARRDASTRVQTHKRVPVGATMDGASRGLTEDDFVLVQYLQADSDRPVVTQAFYDDQNRAPITEEGDFRRQIGESAVIEVITDDNGDQVLNVGAQGDEDRGGLTMGLTMNLNDGSFSLTDADEKGLFFDGSGNGILKWESMAQPWGAAGPVEWVDDPSSGGGSGGDGDGTDGEDTTTRTVSVSVIDSSDAPVSGATVGIEQLSAGDGAETAVADGGSVDLGPESGTGDETELGPGDESTTNAEGLIEFSLPPDDYALTVTFPADNESGAVVQGELTVGETDLNVVVGPDAVRSVEPASDLNEDGPVSRDPTEDETTVEDAIVAEVNAARASADTSTTLPELTADVDLAAVARWHSEYLASIGEVTHTDETYGDHSDRLEAANIETTRSGENLARYSDSTNTAPELLAEEIVASWSNSEGHAQNLYSADYADHGVGVHIDTSGSAEDVYITHLFTGE